MAAIDSKYHLKIGDFGFVLARMARADRHIYTREEAPHFVNKFSSGDPNYRDATFFPHWAQLNWLNGFNQEFYDDGGKFFRSSAVDPTAQEKLTLQKAMNSSGTVSNNGVRAFGLRSSSSAGWWDTNYDYRKRVTITAGETIVPSGYPIHMEEDTAALETAGKLLANRNDWQIIYWNGTAWVQLDRDYIDTDSTFFALQAAIAVSAEDNDYYIYYDHSGESSNKQPTDDDTWNAVYAMYGTTLDANTVAMWHFKEGSSSSVEDQDGASDLTLTGSYAWVETNMRWGRWVDIRVANSYAYFNDSGETFNLGDMTIEMVIRTGSSLNGKLFDRTNSSDRTHYSFEIKGGKVYFWYDGSTPLAVTGSTSLEANTTYHVAVTVDYSAASGKVFLNGSQDGSNSGSSLYSRNPSYIGIGGKHFGTKSTFPGYIANVRVSNIQRTSFPAALSAEPTNATAVETPQGDAASGGVFEIYSADDSGKVYLFDGTTTWNEKFDVRRLVWNDDTDLVDGTGLVGDDGGTEKATAQSFTPAADTRVKGVEIYIKKNTGTPGDITVRIETDDSNKPSGTLADTSLAGTISSFTTASYGWITLDFDSVSTANLENGTKYWIVLKIAAGSNDNNYAWAADTSSPTYGTYDTADSTDGGSTWTADSTKDMMFRLLGEATRVNQMAQVRLSGNTKLWMAVGNPNNTRNNNARMYTYDGTNWELAYTFTGTGTAAALCLQVYESKLFVGLSPNSIIQVTSDGSAFTESKDIDQPDNPGYPWDMEVYNQRLYVAGGHPEFASDNNSLGYLWSYDNFSWQFIYDFSFTVVKSLKVFDGLLFMGTVSKKLYVFNTASIDKLFEFPWNLSISWMGVWDDKLAIGTNGNNGLTGNEAIYLFDRNGFHRAFTPSNVGIVSGIVARNELIVGNTGTTIHKISNDTYADSGTMQTSYYEAQLPNIYKLYRTITLMFDSLPTGASIKVQYKTDETDSWTTLGTANTAESTSESFNFASGIYSHKLSLRITLATSDTSATPTLRKTILKYVLSPDFKYMWKMKLACPDNMIWLDETEPRAIVGTAISAGDATITLKSSQKSTPTDGFPDPDGEAMYACIEEEDGTEDTFTYTGKTDTTLTGVPTTGTNALTSHGVDTICRVRGADLHKKILELKQTRKMFTFTDIDNIEYTVFFHSYQSDSWVINPEDVGGGLENEVPITLLEA